jgi:hypothetical protein
VLTILKEIIRDEEMFDMRNPAIILCDKDLEAALNMRALHVTEIRYRTSCTCYLRYYISGFTGTSCVYRDEILGHQFDKRLDSFALCYSQSLLLADFRENYAINRQ